MPSEHGVPCVALIPKKGRGFASHGDMNRYNEWKGAQTILRYLLTLRYDGTRYHGWQVQQNALAVQPVVQDALERILQQRPGVSGCSRTDSGVHAAMYCCHFDCDRPLEPDRLTRALNFALPKDICVLSSRRVPDDFHARYSCTGKEYAYQFLNAPSRDPFYEAYSIHVHAPMNLGRLNEAAARFCGRHDFTSFCAARAKEGNPTRTIRHSRLERRGNLVVFRVEADGFLYNMVRIMAGTLLQVAFGRFSPEDMERILAARDRAAAGPTAPAKGLFLNRVFYDGLPDWEVNADV